MKNCFFAWLANSSHLNVHLLNDKGQNIYQNCIFMLFLLKSHAFYILENTYIYIYDNFLV